MAWCNLFQSRLAKIKNNCLAEPSSTAIDLDCSLIDESVQSLLIQYMTSISMYTCLHVIVAVLNVNYLVDSEVCTLSDFLTSNSLN